MFFTPPPLALNHTRDWYWKEKKKHLQLVQCFFISQLSSEILSNRNGTALMPFETKINKQQQKLKPKTHHTNFSSAFIDLFFHDTHEGFFFSKIRNLTTQSFFLAWSKLFLMLHSPTSNSVWLQHEPSFPAV